tara:strand:+ start:28133 stop:29074 length:942 start_codon:yes stop_codon:yes gene_type:complete
MSVSDNVSPVLNPTTFTSTGAQSNITNSDLQSFMEGGHADFTATQVHQVKSGIETETKENDKGGTDTIYFRLEVDESTGESVRIYVTTVEVPDDDPNKPGGKGLSFGIPKELLYGNDPEKAEKVAIAYTNMMVETGLQFAQDGKRFDLHCPINYKWRALTEEKLAESMIRHADEFQARGIVACIEGRVIVGPAEPSARKQAQVEDTHPLDEHSLMGRQQFFSLRAMKPNMDNSPIGKILQQAEEMNLNPETLMRSRGINPELPDNIRKLAELAENSDNAMALTVLESVAENRENASPLAQSLLAGVKNTKKDQ